MIDLIDDGFVTLDVVAQRMNLSEAEIIDLVRHRVLRAENLGYGLIYVQPAIF